MNGPIDRNDRDDVLKQIGFVFATIKEINRKIGKIDNELRRMPHKVEHLEKQKIKLREMISKKHVYLNILQESIENENT